MGVQLITERRQHKRYPAQPGTYAAFKPHSSRRGQIVDISMGGLAFHYIAGKWKTGRQSLAILVYGEGIFLNDIPCEPVSDFIIGHSSPFSVTPIRRCGVKFLGLNSEQAEKINQFIACHTIRDA